MDTNTNADTRIFKTIEMKQELFLLRLMDIQLEKTYGRLILYIVTASNR